MIAPPLVRPVPNHAHAEHPSGHGTVVQHVPLQGNLPPAILVHAPDTAKLTNGQNGLNVTAVAVQAPNPAAVLLRSMPSMVGTNALH